MALTITKTENGITIGERFIFNPQEVVSGIINLKATIGTEMAYDRGNLLSIDFPGEYDIDGILINAYLGKGEKLNFLIVSEAERFGIIQSPEILELDEVEGMDTRIFSDEAIEKKLDQLEMDGERINVSHLDI
ncbi:MAG: hypothetical protein LBG52_02930 [Candidatus Peribacteria bacterium]|jgi:hypothetical protein|nr:hypothetical protein [Candidatus Peribacteria bacterium]